MGGLTFKFNIRKSNDSSKFHITCFLNLDLLADSLFDCFLLSRFSSFSFCAEYEKASN